MELSRKEMASMLVRREYPNGNKTLSRLAEAVGQLECYNELAKSGWIEQVLYDLGIIMSEMAGIEQPVLDLGRHKKTWIGFGMDHKPEIKIKF